MIQEERNAAIKNLLNMYAKKAYCTLTFEGYLKGTGEVISATIEGVLMPIGSSGRIHVVKGSNELHVSIEDVDTINLDFYDKDKVRVLIMAAHTWEA